MINKLIKTLRKPLNLDYINDQLRSKGIATNPRGENNLTFKLYDMNWDVYCEKGRLGIRISFNLGNDIDTNCLLQAANQLNNERWIVKSFIDFSLDETESNSEVSKTRSTIIFSFESFCFSAYDFTDVYEFAIYAMTDAIEFHRKCYAKLLENKKTQRESSTIGFQTTQNDRKETIDIENVRKRNKIGFV